MAALGILLSLFSVVAIVRARYEPVETILGRVCLMNVYYEKYLIFDPLSVELEPRVLLWNVARAIPLRGGAWFHLVRSPHNESVDYNLIGGVQGNYTLCVSMLQPAGNLHHVHGYIDSNHLAVPECRWHVISNSLSKTYWVANKLYGGHLKAASYKYNVDPLRRSVFLAIRDRQDAEDEKWVISRVLEPNDIPFDD